MGHGMKRKFNSAIFLFLLLLSACNGTTLSVAAETPKELMNGWVGTWQVELQLNKSLLTPEKTTVRGTETIRWALNEQFLQSEQSYAGGAYKKLSLTRYDPNEGVFLFWDFDSNGSFPMGVTRGQWNAEKSEITISGEYFGGATARGVVRFIDRDHAEISLRVMSADGTVLIDLDAKSERSK